MRFVPAQTLDDVLKDSAADARRRHVADRLARRRRSDRRHRIGVLPAFAANGRSGRSPRTMPRMPSLVFYISGHGFGHASRDIEVINALHAAAPHVRIVVRTSAPRWLFDLTLTRAGHLAAGRVRHGRCPDRQPAPRRAPRRSRAAARVHADARRHGGDARRVLLRELQARRSSSATSRRSRSLAAHRAGVPSIALGNFTWDWIYAAYPDELGRASRAARADSRRVRARGARAAPAAAAAASTRSDASSRAVHRAALGARRARTCASVRPAGDRRPGAGVVRRLRPARHRPGRARAAAPLHRRGDRERQAARRGDDPRGENGRSRPAERDAAGFGAVRRRARHLRGRLSLRGPRRGPWTSSRPSRATASSPSASPTTRRCSTRRAGTSPSTDVMVREMPRYLRCGFISNEDLYAGALGARARRRARAARTAGAATAWTAPRSSRGCSPTRSAVSP